MLYLFITEIILLVIRTMMLYFVLCTVLTFPIVHSEKNGLFLPHAAKEINSNLPLKDASSDKTSLVVPSEGGTLIANTPDLSLAKDKQQVSLLTLDEESNKPKLKSVVPRKGAPVDFAILVNTTNLHNSTVEEKISNPKHESSPNAFKTLTDVEENNSTSAVSKPTISTKAPKKPLVLSYEALVNADKNIHDEVKIQPTNPSSKTLPNLAKTQIPSPKEEDVIKVYPSRATSHPGMIMPVVITILVVPMFAIVGYLALKRGQEAWKNRHYKRMDFLLDGMYND